jgi:Domain of Unknown Function (DUF1206)
VAIHQTGVELRRRGASLAPTADARAKARSGSGWYAVLARTGLVAKGLSFGIVGFLAAKLAVGHGGEVTSREGALQTIAHHSYGKFLLILLACGFAAYALWRFVQAFAERDDPGDGATGDLKKWGKRAGYVGRGLIYGGLAYSSVKILLGAAQKSQNQRAHKTAAQILSWPAGTWIVGAIGVLIIGAGLWNLYRGLSGSFEDRWRTGQMSHTARTWGVRVGVLGHLARAVVFSLIGIFVVKAALDYNPRDAIGIDGALQKLAHASYGPYLLGVTAAGLVCYGLFCLVDARYRDVSTG